MVLLDDVVQIGRSSASTAPTQLTAALQFRDGAGIRWMAIHVNHSWPYLPRSPQRKLQRVLRRRQITVGRQHEIDRAPLRIDRPIQIRPPAGYANVCFIHAPGAVRLAHLTANPLTQNWRTP